ncbi:MAG: Gfo/Idh/MocA family oxidoreductase [Caldilineaceae bacterium]|jgi:predicted dehydrogenase|nr:Gfo/Idh/MocA family oxidoreductase [Caldilineaceae bacterium]
MTTKIRVGFIGAGRMANLHANLIAKEPDVQIAAAADADAARSAAFVQKWGGVAFSDHRAMLEQARLDAVYICTPTTHHAAIGLDCLPYGVALYVEKPLDLDLHLARRFVEAADADQTLAMTGLQWRYSEAYRRAEELIGDEPIALVNLRWYWTRPPIRWMWDRALAGGQIVDQNIHLIDVGSALAGDITTVYAAYNEQQANHEPEFANWDGYALTMRFARGAVGVCAGAYALFPEIQFEPAADFTLRDCLVRITDKRVQRYTPSGVETWANTEPLHRGVNRAFIAAVRSGDRSHICTPLHNGLTSTAAVLAANRSAQTGAPINVAAFLAAESAA